ncbi:hypothetical protein E3N88_41673 [Mikania micrantha]|uniref:Uncharacterized protein n=1 Tax=Mikania micrantha TaxID=192012 RepID=A0A5N6LJY1_9ASTR|nr:hypothetical protein E3N88_41673 [Mikania micrantha]
MEVSLHNGFSLASNLSRTSKWLPRTQQWLPRGLTEGFGEDEAGGLRMGSDEMSVRLAMICLGFIKIWRLDGFAYRQDCPHGVLAYRGVFWVSNCTPTLRVQPRPTPGPWRQTISAVDPDLDCFIDPPDYLKHVDKIQQE